MTEKSIKFETINPLDIFGANGVYLKLMSNVFPKLKVIQRGNTLKLLGSEDDIVMFEKRLKSVASYLEKYGKLSEHAVVGIFGSSDNEIKDVASDVLVHGVHGSTVKALTPNQQKIVDCITQSDLVFAIGPAGTGKTYTAVAMAVRALKNKEVKRIILTRPAVEAGENLGFLPGDLKEKLDPYLRPLYDALRDMIPNAKLASYLETSTIEIAPLAYMRGRTLDNAFVILDEAQNATDKQLKMFLTRMGQTSKFLITGDITQIDLPQKHSSGLVNAIKILKNINAIKFVFLDETDIVRHKLVSLIVDAYNKHNELINTKS